jgi:hypothetical protein
MKTSSRKTKLVATAAAALITAAQFAPGALAVTAAEQTRESYIVAVEPICKVNTKANEKTLDGVREKIRKGQLKVAAGQFTKAAGAFSKAVTQIKAVPQPAADKAKLGKWVGYLEEETKLLSEIGKALKAEQKTKAQTLSVRLTHNSNVANNSVLGFEFDYCLIDSSRFS